MASHSYGGEATLLQALHEAAQQRALAELALGVTPTGTAAAAAPVAPLSPLWQPSAPNSPSPQQLAEAAANLAVAVAASGLLSTQRVGARLGLQGAHLPSPPADEAHVGDDDAGDDLLPSGQKDQMSLPGMCQEVQPSETQILTPGIPARGGTKSPSLGPPDVLRGETVGYLLPGVHSPRELPKGGGRRQEEQGKEESKHLLAEAQSELDRVRAEVAAEVEALAQVRARKAQEEGQRSGRKGERGAAVEGDVPQTVPPPVSPAVSSASAGWAGQEGRLTPPRVWRRGRRQLDPSPRPPAAGKVLPALEPPLPNKEIACLDAPSMALAVSPAVVGPSCPMKSSSSCQTEATIECIMCASSQSHLDGLQKELSRLQLQHSKVNED